MSDEVIRANVGKTMSALEFDDPAFNAAPKLSDATVAIVTTAGFLQSGDESWQPRDPNYRVIEAGAEGLRLGHLSPNFDRSGVVADLNVVFPLDRLNEMAEEGVIGKVAPRHITFMGAQDGNMNTIRMDTAPAVAKLLKEDGVDVVLLTPV